MIIFLKIMWYTRLVERYKRNPNTVCVVCKKAIYRRPGEIKKNNYKVFCSMACYGIHSRKEKPCIVCKKMILASLNKKTCSRTCSNKHRAGIRYKIGSPKDKVKTLRILKLRLMEKRGRNCERCNYNKYRILQVHHKNKNNKDNRIENLEIICPNCHYEEHYSEKNWFKNNLEK
jgi:hypothetical protein